MAIDISVIVPCYNQEGSLAICLESLLRQTCPRESYEIILVDNASEDRSAEIARGHAGVIVVEEAKRGSYAARNAGVRRAHGSILAFTDSDCEVAPDWLEQIAHAMADERTAVVLGSRRFVRESLLLSIQADYDDEKAWYVFSEGDPQLYYAYTNNMAVKRQVYERCGPFPEVDRGADTVFLSRSVEAYSSAAVRYVPEMAVRHLEMERWYDWHWKMWTYGRSYAHYRHLGATRSLSFVDRWAILRQTIRRHDYSWARATLLLLMGLGAVMAFEAGVIFGTRKNRKKT